MPTNSILGRTPLRSVAGVAILLAASSLWAAEGSESPARMWIEALGQGEGALVQGESPKRWLAQHLDAAYPELLAALDDPNPQLAKAALAFLDQAPARRDLAPTLSRIAADPEHPLFAEATYALCRFADDPQVRKLLVKALANPADFSDA